MNWRERAEAHWGTERLWMMRYGWLNAIDMLGREHYTARHMADHRAPPFAGGNCIPRDRPQDEKLRCRCRIWKDQCCQPMTAEDLLCNECRAWCPGAKGLVSAQNWPATEKGGAGRIPST